MYSMTIFKSPRWWEEKQRFVYDNKTHRRMDFESWDKFERFFYKLSEREMNGKQDAELITPAVFKPDSPRRNVNVTAWAGWAAVDVDDVEIEGDINAFVHNLVRDWKFICYSTASSTQDRPKFRIVLQTDEHIQPANIKHFWYALATDLNSIGDKQCKDFSRMYYVPALYAGANNFIFSGGAEPVSVSGLLRKYPYVESKNSTSFLDRLPDAWKEQIIEHRKSALDNTSYKWTSYKDCPFVSKRLIQEWYTIANTDGSGRYRMIYKIMVAIALNAIKKNYPLTVIELVELIRQLDADTSNKYESRPLEIEANNALEYAYKYGG